MPKRKNPELPPKEQFKRFQETAKELEVGAEAEKSFARLAKKQRPKSSLPSTR